MWKSRFCLWITGPTVLVSLLLLALCCLAAAFLYRQQLTSAKNLEDDVTSTRVADELKNTIADLIAMLEDEKEQVEPLHQRIREQLGHARALADQDKDRELVARLESSMQYYFSLWDKRARKPADERAELSEACLGVLKTEAIARCRKLQEFNAQEILKSEQAHRQTVNWVVASLVGVGVIGALAGLSLGYGAARRLRHSIYHLRVHVQDAANKLGQDLPAVALDEDAGLHEIQEQMQSVVRDIEQVVQKLQQREREVLRAEQLAALGQLAAGVAHEIRNPLTSIKLLVQTLREEFKLRDEPAEDLQVMEMEIRRMERCLQTFLDYARPPKPQFKPVDLAQPISRTLALIAGRARKQQVSVEFTPPAEPILVTADVEQMQQLVVNLCLNALDAMPRGGKLYVELDELSGNEVELTVRDTGAGIAAKLLPALFVPFVSTKETGLGLGLVTSRRIAECHGGSLQASNAPEGGACFRLRMPRLKKSEAMSAAFRSEPVSAAR